MTAYPDRGSCCLCSGQTPASSCSGKGRIPPSAAGSCFPWPAGPPGGRSPRRSPRRQEYTPPPGRFPERRSNPPHEGPLCGPGFYRTAGTHTPGSPPLGGPHRPGLPDPAKGPGPPPKRPPPGQFFPCVCCKPYLTPCSPRCRKPASPGGHLPCAPAR